MSISRKHISNPSSVEGDYDSAYIYEIEGICFVFVGIISGLSKWKFEINIPNIIAINDKSANIRLDALNRILQRISDDFRNKMDA